MRLWSLHPKYLDPQGLVAVWREGLLALAVLEGKTKGYVHHPQLNRFRKTKDTIESIKMYLWHICQESIGRGYHFNAAKILNIQPVEQLTVTTGQLEYELKHLKSKLKTRTPAMFKKFKNLQIPDPHPIFKSIIGTVEAWEKA
jgi:hypothetical protein